MDTSVWTPPPKPCLLLQAHHKIEDTKISYMLSRALLKTGKRLTKETAVLGFFATSEVEKTLDPALSLENTSGPSEVTPKCSSPL